MGVDTIKQPFEVPKGVCPVCHGDKWAMGNNGNPNVEVKPEKCAFCNGTGKV